MNRSIFTQTGGYPLTAERLEELQTTFDVFSAFGALAGDLTIITGCETPIGSNVVHKGVVYINGEPLEFRQAVAADANARVVIIEENVTGSFENGTNKTVYTKRYATIGTAETSWLWTDFKRPLQTKTLEDRLSAIEKKLSVFQTGGAVIAWFKPVADIPAGWREVTNMRGRTVFGYDPNQPEFNAIGKAEGIKTKTLSIEELPKISPVNGPGIKKGGTFGGSGGISLADTPSGDYAEGQLIKPFGGDKPFSILNPYRVAAYIEFIG
ncbi:hypothetical protein [Flavobacterium gelatinilyticum]|uniref:hypothetical protein n=1 Tax=Flavobacterium gelatinilyticum TaxID=3003260 RepID=UPI002480CE05|nr:hypothetical protein [Flavobacterium gelatinilyticum]